VIGPSAVLQRGLELGARINSSVKKKLGWNHVADRPARFAVECSNLRVTLIRRVGLDDRVFPKTTVIGGFNLDRERCVANVLAVDLNFSTRWLRSDLEIQSLSHDLRVRCASGADEKNGSREGHRNGSENWEGPIHGSCLIRNGTGSSLILFAEIFTSFSREAFKKGLFGWSNSIGLFNEA
jgi:hypothetical protein